MPHTLPNLPKGCQDTVHKVSSVSFNPAMLRPPNLPGLEGTLQLPGAQELLRSEGKELQLFSRLEVCLGNAAGLAGP